MCVLLPWPEGLGHRAPQDIVVWWEALSRALAAESLLASAPDHGVVAMCSKTVTGALSVRVRQDRKPGLLLLLGTGLEVAVSQGLQFGHLRGPYC